eukprot:122776_1
MSESKKQNIEDKCEQDFSHCKHAHTLKALLKQYNNILLNKNVASDYDVQIAVHTLIENFTENDDTKNQYSNVKLLNDFYHIEFQHNTNNDPKQFELFYNYLFSDNTLICNIHSCKSVERRYKRRHNRLIEVDSNGNDEIENKYSLNLMSRIHTYFIHSYDISKLRNEEITHIEKKLKSGEFKDYNEDDLEDEKIALVSNAMSIKQKSVSNIVGTSQSSKFCWTSNVVADKEHKQNDEEITSIDILNDINTTEICGILTNNKIMVEPTSLASAFTKHGYEKQQLIDDLCDMTFNMNEDEPVTLLSKIFKDNLQINLLKQKE